MRYFIILLLLTGCKEKVLESSEIIGTWNLTDYPSFDQDVHNIDESEDWQVWEFKENGDLIITTKDGIENYKWVFGTLGDRGYNEEDSKLFGDPISTIGVGSYWFADSSAHYIERLTKKELSLHARRNRDFVRD